MYKDNVGDVKEGIDYIFGDFFDKISYEQVRKLDEVKKEIEILLYKVDKEKEITKDDKEACKIVLKILVETYKCFDVVELLHRICVRDGVIDGEDFWRECINIVVGFLCLYLEHKEGVEGFLKFTEEQYWDMSLKK